MDTFDDNYYAFLQEIIKYKSYVDEFEISKTNNLILAKPKESIKNDLVRIISDLQQLIEKTFKIIKDDTAYGNIEKTLQCMALRISSAFSYSKAKKKYNTTINVLSDSFLLSLHNNFGRSDEKVKEELTVAKILKVESENNFYLNCLLAFQDIANLEIIYNGLTKTGHLTKTDFVPEA